MQMKISLSNPRTQTARIVKKQEHQFILNFSKFLIFLICYRLEKLENPLVWRRWRRRWRRPFLNENEDFLK